MLYLSNAPLKLKEEKLQNEKMTFCFSLFKTTEICFGSTKMGIFYQDKAVHVREKIRKNYFVPSEKYSSYAPEAGCKIGYVWYTHCTI